jgi:hypothetical protein
VIPVPRVCRVVLLLSLLAGYAVAQDAASPTVTFTLDFPNSDPEHFVLSVRADGHATYDSIGKITSLSQETDPFHLEFMISAASRERIFDLAKRAHFFEGDLDTKLPNPAFTGKKTAAYKDASRSTQATYDYSAIPAVQEFTAFCQHLSETLEFGRTLKFYQRYQKLALDDELRRMEEMQQENELAELPAIAPILQGIANDHTLLNMVRGRALRILYKAGVHS